MEEQHNDFFDVKWKNIFIISICIEKVSTLIVLHVGIWTYPHTHLPTHPHPITPTFYLYLVLRQDFPQLSVAEDLGGPFLTLL